MTAGRLFDVVAVGRAYTDVVSAVDASFLAKFGIVLEGSLYPEPRAFCTLRDAMPNPLWVPGGPGANMLAGLQAMGAKTGFFGKVFADRAGDLFRAEFDRAGVAWCCDPLANKGPLSGCCLVFLTDDGKRSFALTKGCVDAFTLSDFQQFDFTQASLFFVEAHQMVDPSRDVLLAAMEQARASGCRVVLTLQQMFDWENDPITARRMIDLADVVLGNKVEQDALQKVVIPAHDAPHKLWVTTCGDQGAEAWQDGCSVHVPSVAPQKLISSLGAGDQFAAGLLFGLARGWDLTKSLKLGTHAAAAILEEVGARPTQSLETLVASLTQD